MGFFSGIALDPNPLEQKRLALVAAGREVMDLTDSNLTNLNTRVSPDLLTSLFSAYLGERKYRPEPRGLIAARQAVSQYYADRGAKDISPEGIFFTASTSEAYRLLFSLLAEPGDRALTPALGYPLIEQIAADARLDIRHYGIEKRDAFWRYSAEGELGDAAVLCIVSPHNPTGLVLREAPLWMRSSKIPVIADEVFCEFVWKGAQPLPLGACFPETPVFHLHGLSKLLALPDLKLGWIALNAKALEEYGARLELLNDLYLSAAQPIQHALPVLLNSRKPVIQGLRKEIFEALQFCLERLSKCRKLEAALPDAGSVIFAKLSSYTDAEEFALKLLDETGVLVHPGHFYGDSFAGYIFISALTPRPKLEQGLEHLTRLLA